jgi:hypothetical protein
MLLIHTCRETAGKLPAALYPNGSVRLENKLWKLYQTFAE